MSIVHIHIVGPVGSGKSALAGEIEILCKALGLDVSWPDGQSEKNMTGADWQHALDMYRPTVVIHESDAQGLVPAALQSQPAAPGVTGAVQTLIETLKADPEYAWAWHCNVAMAAVDEGLSHYAANKAAARFLSWLAKIDTTKHPGFPKAPEQPAAAGMSDADLYGTLEPTIVSRYVVEKRVGGGFWGYCVKAGDGAQEIFVGHKNACEHVRQALQTACLDGAYMAHEKARAILALRPQSDTLCFELSAMLGCPPSDTDVVACVSSLLTPRPQAVPMTEADLLKCLIQANCLGTVHMSHEHGPYYVDRPSHAAVRLKDAIEAHHGITAQGAQGGEG